MDAVASVTLGSHKVNLVHLVEIATTISRGVGTDGKEADYVGRGDLDMVPRSEARRVCERLRWCAVVCGGVCDSRPSW